MHPRNGLKPEKAYLLYTADQMHAYAQQHAAAIKSQLEAANAEIERLKDDLQFVERWANHHGTKPHMTAEQALGMIQHYPGIVKITRSYSNGKVPETYDPYAVIERLGDALLLAHEHMRLYLPHYTENFSVFATVSAALTQPEQTKEPK